MNTNWPKRAVVTAGMPYGNKSLHFGHIGGVFVPADCFARFLKDRIGADNVLFISGTDCFGSPIDEGFRKLSESGKFDGTITDYVEINHQSQVNTLRKFDVNLSIFEGSGLGLCKDKHQQLTLDVLNTLYENGWLKSIDSKQFYDAQAGMFLNGRQVTGRCPVAGCKSEVAYADECSLGHQYDPADLIAPKSSVTGTVPELRPVKNWYFDLPAYMDYLRKFVDVMRANDSVRDVVPNDISEFLASPVVFIKNESFDTYSMLKDELPQHTYTPAEGNKQSFTISFDNIYDRDAAKEILVQNNIRFRTGKTLVPFRLTGNAAWGVKAPNLDGKDQNLTVWCWPESLWAPISFTMAALEKLNSPYKWQDFWSSDDACVYQFIGQDNIYFYGVAQPALFDALQNKNGSGPAQNMFSGLQQSTLVANHHILFGKTKASSSGAVKPPSGDELLDFYTPEQLRAHWLALGLAQKSVSFSPKPFEADEKLKNDPRVADPVLKEGALLTNVFNRLARSCFYEAQNNFDCKIQMLRPSDEVVNMVADACKKYEELMHKVELYSVMQLMDQFVRSAQKYWADNIKKVANDELAAGIDVREGGKPSDERVQVLANSFYLLCACTLMMHPIVPAGCETICDFMNFDKQDFFNWQNFFNIIEEKFNGNSHSVKLLPPRFDFFKKHKSQYK